jgi:hypothetical protein
MTFLANYPGVDMRPMIKAGIFGKVVDPDPANRLSFFAGFGLQLVVEAKCIIKFLHIWRDLALRWTPFLPSLVRLGASGIPTGGHQPMAIHAQTGRGNSRMRAFRCAVMAVKTSYPQIAGMKLVRISDGLCGLVTLLITGESIAAKVNNQGDKARPKPSQQQISQKRLFQRSLLSILRLNVRFSHPECADSHTSLQFGELYNGLKGLVFREERLVRMSAAKATIPGTRQVSQSPNTVPVPNIGGRTIK